MTEITTAIAAVALVLSIINTWWMRRRPRLTISYRDETPFKKFLRVILDSEPHPTESFARVRVKNEKPMLAKTCVGKIVHWYTEGEPVESFDPIRLHWVSNRINDYSPIDLAYGEFEYLDLLQTVTRDRQIRIYTNTHERGAPYTFNLGNHVFQLAVYSANESSTSAWFRVISNEGNIESAKPWISVAKLSKGELRKLGILAKKE